MASLEVDAALIRATERLIDGGVGHHYYGTIHRYRAAAAANDTAAFAAAERMLRAWVLHRTSALMPETYRKAVDALIQGAAEDEIPCEACRRPKRHGKRCPGDGVEPCWALRDSCSMSEGRCCRCAESAAARARTTAENRREGV